MDVNQKHLIFMDVKESDGLYWEACGNLSEGKTVNFTKMSDTSSSTSSRVSVKHKHHSSV